MSHQLHTYLDINGTADRRFNTNQKSELQGGLNMAKPTEFECAEYWELESTVQHNIHEHDCDGLYSQSSPRSPNSVQHLRPCFFAHLIWWSLSKRIVPAVPVGATLSLQSVGKAAVWTTNNLSLTFSGNASRTFNGVCIGGAPLSCKSISHGCKGRRLISSARPLDKIFYRFWKSANYIASSVHYWTNHKI